MGRFESRSCLRVISADRRPRGPARSSPFEPLDQPVKRAVEHQGRGHSPAATETNSCCAAMIREECALVRSKVLEGSWPAPPTLWREQAPAGAASASDSASTILLCAPQPPRDRGSAAYIGRRGRAARLLRRRPSSTEGSAYSGSTPSESQQARSNRSTRCSRTQRDGDSAARSLLLAQEAHEIVSRIHHVCHVAPTGSSRDADRPPGQEPLYERHAHVGDALPRRFRGARRPATANVFAAPRRRPSRRGSSPPHRVVPDWSNGS